MHNTADFPRTDPTTAPPWWNNEHAIPLSAVPDHLPPRGDGSRRSSSTIYRWTTGGVADIRLRRFRIGPRGWHTTAEELARFAKAMTSIAGGDL